MPKARRQPAALADPLSDLFDLYRDAPAEYPDLIGVGGAMRYLKDLNVELDEITVLAVSEMLQSPTLGQFTREGFMQAWKPLKADTIAKQRSHVAQLRVKLAKDTDYFRRVYRYAFPLAKQETQRIIPLDTAIEYWRMIFAAAPPGRTWITTAKAAVAAAAANGGNGGSGVGSGVVVERRTPWFDYFVEYLQSSRWSKAINRDQWNQTFEFHRRTMEDPSLAWWDKAEAWPLMLDGFAVYVQEKWAALSSPGGGGETPGNAIQID